MHKINRKVEYALMALRHMLVKTPGELTSAKEVSDLFATPFDVTARVLQVMAQKEILKSVQGAHGGYLITRDLTRLSLFELMELLLGPVAVAKCLHEAEGCEMLHACNIVTPMQNLNRRLIDFYKGMTVAELLQQRHSQKGKHGEKDSPSTQH